MTVSRLAVSFDPVLAREVQRAAEGDNETTSAWLADAARRKLMAKGLLEVVQQWEDIHGKITPEELRAAKATMTMRRRRRARK